MGSAADVPRAGLRVLLRHDDQPMSRTHRGTALWARSFARTAGPQPARHQPKLFRLRGGSSARPWRLWWATTWQHADARAGLRRAIGTAQHGDSSDDWAVDDGAEVTTARPTHPTCDRDIPRVDGSGF